MVFAQELTKAYILVIYMHEANQPVSRRENSEGPQKRGRSEERQRRVARSRGDREISGRTGGSASIAVGDWEILQRKKEYVRES